MTTRENAVAASPSNPPAFVDRAAVDRIICEVGKRHVPTNIDRADLGFDLNFARISYVNSNQFRKKKTNQTKNNLKRLSNVTMKLEGLLTDDVLTAIGPHCQIPLDELGRPPSYPASAKLEHLRSILKELRNAIDRASRPLSAEAGALFDGYLGLNERSAFEHLIGVHLVAVYEKHFTRAAGVSKGEESKCVYGPYIRFCEQALKEMRIFNGGRPYAADAIDRAFRDAKKGRPREKRANKQKRKKTNQKNSGPKVGRPLSPVRPPRA